MGWGKVVDGEGCAGKLVVMCQGFLVCKSGGFEVYAPTFLLSV